jgi:hypothetical protein
MVNTTNIRIIAEPEDEVAQQFIDFARKEGCRVIQLTHVQAAQSMTVRVTCEMTTVTPDIPTFFRLPTALQHETDRDTRFLWSESLAAVWAGLALSKRAVINRPGRYGLLGRWSKSIAVSRLRAGLAGPREFFANLPSPSYINDLPEQWWVEDMITGDVEPLPAILKGSGMYHFTQGSRNATYELVVVVGQHAFPSTSCSLPGLHIEQHSIHLVTALDLTFAAVAWEIDPTCTSAWSVVIHAHPQIHHLAPRWEEISSAILGLLLE